jgi:hypothetical protein
MPNPPANRPCDVSAPSFRLAASLFRFQVPASYPCIQCPPRLILLRSSARAIIPLSSAILILRHSSARIISPIQVSRFVFVWPPHIAAFKCPPDIPFMCCDAAAALPVLSPLRGGTAPASGPPHPLASAPAFYHCSRVLCAAVMALLLAPSSAEQRSADLVLTAGVTQASHPPGLPLA